MYKVDIIGKQTSMKIRMVFHFTLILLSIVIALGGVYGRTLAKRPLLTHMTQSGQVYDCVDFYKQPAFDHPLLKNHVPKVRLNSTKSIRGKFNTVYGGCPDGSVPILRYDQPPSPHTLQAKVHCYAVVRTNTNNKFYGSNALPSVYKPAVQGFQWSSARIKLSNGPDSIQAGWMVNPLFFKDKEAHLFGRFNVGPTECLNLHCAGFVQVSPDMPLGSTPQIYSTIGGQQYMWNISIDKHSDDGHWWLSMTWDSVGTFQIGYWPKTLFTALQDAAAQVEWGGEIDDPAAAEPYPSMGNGLKADYDQLYSSFFQHITVVDESHNNVIPHGIEKFSDCPKLYTVLDRGDLGGNIGRLIFYGGSQKYR